MGIQPSVGVHQAELKPGLEQGLMVMRAVEIDEPASHLFQSGQRGGASVDELAVGARGCEGPLENELPRFARLQTTLLKKAG